MAGRFLSLFKPVKSILPEVQAPVRKPSFSERILWTAFALIVYLVMSEIPLYHVTRGADIYFAYRVIFASRRGTLMELGIGPIVTAGLVLQILVGGGLIEADLSKPEDRALFTVASKFLSIILALFQITLFLSTGVWGYLTLFESMIVFMQLLAATLIVILLDEMVQKGWGFGSGISLFIAGGVIQEILWQAFAPIPAPDGSLYGAIPSFIQNIISGNPSAAFFREHGYPDMTGLISTMILLLVLLYLQGIRVDIPISFARYRGYRGRYPIQLLYLSSIPVIFTSALFSNLYVGAQILWSNMNRDNSNPWLNWIGMFTTDEAGIRPIGPSLAYYLTPPRSIVGILEDPVRAIIYITLMAFFCIIFSWTWLTIGGIGPSDVARQLVDAGVQIPGYRMTEKTVYSILNKYIPVVGLFGGFLIGLIAGLADLINVFGSGIGILLTIGIIYNYYQILLRERLFEMYPGLERMIGGR
ncbi:MAG: preprotein translocase subunit SecY [Candidatus Bathyarchaeia archaeon]|nr:preprotein translocase subunit SecY [Candidatus Bathyarchaeota archaeon]